jgi:hypothetical protein
MAKIKKKKKERPFDIADGYFDFEGKYWLYARCLYWSINHLFTPLN